MVPEARTWMEYRSPVRHQRPLHRHTNYASAKQENQLLSCWIFVFDFSFTRFFFSDFFHPRKIHKECKLCANSIVACCVFQKQTTVGVTHGGHKFTVSAWSQNLAMARLLAQALWACAISLTVSLPSVSMILFGIFNQYFRHRKITNPSCH